MKKIMFNDDYGLQRAAIELSKCKTRDEQLIKAGKMICDMWILHWTSDDAEYLLKRAGVRLLYK